MEHKEYSDKYLKASVPCDMWHITFGGRCLNCGYDPDPVNPMTPAQMFRHQRVTSEMGDRVREALNVK